jgi:hypothetical protein
VGRALVRRHRVALVQLEESTAPEDHVGEQVPHRPSRPGNSLGARRGTPSERCEERHEQGDEADGGQHGDRILSVMDPGDPNQDQMFLTAVFSTRRSVKTG